MGRHIENIKNEYIKNLAIYHDTDRAIEISEAPIYSPIYKPLIVHEDERPITKEHNTMLLEMCTDIDAINADLSSAVIELYSLIDEYNSQFQKIKDTLQKELELQSDLNMLCSANSNFDNTINIGTNVLTPVNSNSSNYETSNIFHLPKINEKEVYINIESVSGNGYTGNDYVYDTENETYLKDIVDTSNTDYITDGIEEQYFEYSRLTSSDASNISLCPAVNNDSNYVRCTIYFQSNDVFNILKINSEQQYLKIINLYTSLDGLAYSQVSEFENFSFNNDAHKYSDNNYIYRSGVLNLPDSKYVKITFESPEYTTDETIAFNKKVSGQNISTQLTILKNVKRNVIRINTIKAYKIQYDQQLILSTGNLLDNYKIGNINAVAIFANEYVPNKPQQNSNSDYIKYYYIINDKEYEVIPINSHEQDTKIIRSANNLDSSSYTQYIGDNIVSLRLKIALKAVNAYNSPYLTNVKVLFGEKKGDNIQ